jgi:blocked early in transport 1
MLGKSTSFFNGSLIAVSLFLSTLFRPPLTIPPDRQNQTLLASLHQKTSQLRGITDNIYAQASNQQTLDNTNEVFSNMGTSLRGSMGRMGRMARQGDRVAVLKLAGIIIVSFLVLYFVLGFVWRLVFGR